MHVRAISSLGPADRTAFGDKAVLLARAVSIGLRVPPGFAIAAELVTQLAHGDGRQVVRDALAALEAAEGVRLGEGLCVAVRPSSDQSQPGGHPTILDVGASRSAIPALETRLGDRGAALDARLRFLRALSRARGVAAARPAVRGARGPMNASVAEVEAEIATLEGQLGLAPNDADRELFGAIEAVAGYGLPVVIQAMRFGTSRCGISGAGTASSRHPITGEPVVFGEIAWERQGEDVSLGRGAGVSLRRAAAGRRGDESLEARAPGVLTELAGMLALAERSLGDVADLEIALEAGVLWVLQLRATVLTPRAEVRTLVDRAEEGTLTREEAIERVRLASMARVGRVELVPEQDLPAASVLGRGLGASPGAATGRVAIAVEDAVSRASRGERIVLVRSDASPEDAPAVRAAVAVATASGGLTSHAAVMSRALGRPCAVSVSSLRVRGDEVTVEGGASPRRLLAGDIVTVDGTRGLLVLGAAPTRWIADDAAPAQLASWARERSSVRVLVPEDAGGDPPAQARALDADGVWNGRTAIDLSGVERPEWGTATAWAGPDEPFPPGDVVVVQGALVAAARVAAAVTTIRATRT